MPGPKSTSPDPDPDQPDALLSEVVKSLDSVARIVPSVTSGGKVHDTGATLDLSGSRTAEKITVHVARPDGSHYNISLSRTHTSGRGSFNSPDSGWVSAAVSFVFGLFSKPKK